MSTHWAYVQEVKPNRDFPGSDVFSVRCPFCKNLHWHGRPEGTDWGSRASHCGKGDYEVRRL